MTVEHPDYPVRRGDPKMDRCTCGGVRFWHAPKPGGCDVCDCQSFVMDVQATANARVKFRAKISGGEIETRPHREVHVFAGPEGAGASVGTLTMTTAEADDFVELLASNGGSAHG